MPSLWPFNDQSCIPKMPYSTVLLPTNYINAPFQKAIKASLRVFLINVPVWFNKSFQLSEEVFNWFKIGWVWRQLHTSITTHLLDPLCVMDRCIIHNENRLRLWPSTTQRQELLYEIFKNGAVCGSLEDVCENNAILCICWQNLISLLTLELGNLDWSHTKGRPSRPSKSNSFVTARFIYENIVIRTEFWRVMQVQVSEISIPCLCYTANCFFGLTVGS